ncbi:universal stress protein [Arhodomonas sp. AD133]|uniref:universal stress protein n=1 Tax=Arhodomonas sp. AD133 TaxID=3415009 RepID=UPI003EC05C88
MVPRSLLVYVDDAASCAVRVRTAAELAAQWSAHLTGVAVADVMLVPEFVPTQTFEKQLELARQRNAALRERFEELTRGRELVTEWRATDTVTAGGTALDVLAAESRYADLAVVGQPDIRDVHASVPTDLPGQLALLSGRPVLAVPYAWREQPVGRRVLVAWDSGRESARAVADAIPLLASADAVRVLALTGSGHEAAHGEQPAADIAVLLARHGVNVEASHQSLGDMDVASALLSAASDYSADLMVMGAYGRARLREMILGGTTRSVLGSMTLPVLLSH